MINITSKRYPDQFYFQSRMLFFKKNKDESHPMLDEIRPITITSLHQKILERYLLKKL